VIEGQHTKLTRVAHGIDYDPVHDLIVASEPLASSIVTYRGGSNGDVPPVRVIQGTRTKIHSPWQVAVDSAHNEIWYADFGGGYVAAFPLMANGDVAPLRTIRDHEDGMRGVSGVAVDPERNLVFVAARSAHAPGAILVFDRLADGESSPRAIIAGPTTGITGLWHVQVHGGKIFASITGNDYRPPYDSGGYAPVADCKGPISEYAPRPLGFIAIWNENDHGDVPPRAIIRGPSTGITTITGLAIDPIHGEVFTRGTLNGVLAFLIPNFF